MRLRGAISIPREDILQLKWDAFKHLLRGIVTVTKTNFPRVRYGLVQYLKSEGIGTDDKSLMAWLQDNPGDTIGLFLFEERNALTFRLVAGTEAELKQIGVQNAEGDNSQRSTSIRQIDMGEKARLIIPRRI